MRWAVRTASTARSPTCLEGRGGRPTRAPPSASPSGRKQLRRRGGGSRGKRNAYSRSFRRSADYNRRPEAGMRIVVIAPFPSTEVTEGTGSHREAEQRRRTEKTLTAVRRDSPAERDTKEDECRACKDTTI